MVEKLKRLTLFIVICAITASFAVIAIAFNVKNDDNTAAYAATFNLNYGTNEGDRTGGRYIGINSEDIYSYNDEVYSKRRYDEFKQRIYVNASEVESAIDKITYIEYDKVALLSELDTELTNKKGKITENREILEENVRVNIEDLIDTGNPGEKFKYYFEVSTQQICAWVFRVYYNIPGEKDSLYTGNEILYCLKVDTVAPTCLLQKKVFNGNLLNYTYRFTDPVDKSASSGISKIIAYKKPIGGSEYEVYYERNGNNATSDVADIALERTLSEYYIEVVDWVGNSTGKIKIAEFTEASYDETFESNLDIAKNDLASNKFSEALETEFHTAYYKYMSVTRDKTATDEDKEKAKAEMKVVYQKFAEAKNNALSGIVKCNIEIINGEYIKGFEIKEYSSALDFLPYGESSNMSFTLAQYKYADVKDKKIGALTEVGYENASDLYCVTIKLTDSSGIKVSKPFSVPVVIKFPNKDGKELAAVQEVYNPSGEVLYYKCTLVQYADGTVAVNVPYSAGIVNIFVKSEKKEKNLYWLFALTAIPLLVGVVLIIYAFRKMNKIKKENANKSESDNEKNTDNEKNIGDETNNEEKNNNENKQKTNKPNKKKKKK